MDGKQKMLLTVALGGFALVAIALIAEVLIKIYGC